MNFQAGHNLKMSSKDAKGDWVVWFVILVHLVPMIFYAWYVISSTRTEKYDLQHHIDVEPVSPVSSYSRPAPAGTPLLRNA